MTIFVKAVFNLLFNLILGVFFIFCLLKISCCKLSDLKDSIKLSLVNFYNARIDFYKNLLNQFVEYPRNMFNQTRMATIQNVYAEVTEKLIIRKK